MEEFKKIYSPENFKRIIREDIKRIKKHGLASLLSQWMKRKNSLLLPIKITLKRIYLLLPIQSYLKKRTWEKRLGKRRKVPFNTETLSTLNTSGEFGSVSVVINTKNSPEYFPYLLNKYKHQKGFKKIEIIVVDSGSNDDTLRIAKDFGCVIVEIKPEEFKHGRSRNIGVDLAKSDYILNAVTDATPTSGDLLFKMASKLEKNKAASVSPREIPRVNADTFACWTVWNHYNSMFEGRTGDIWVETVKDFESLGKIEQRRLALINDVFAFHRSSIIKKERYDDNIRYAEDLELSIRYIKKNIKFGFLENETIIHSHTRNPEYFLKRYFVDTNAINEVFQLLPENFVRTNFFSQGANLEDFSTIMIVGDKILKGFGYKNLMNKYLEIMGTGKVPNKHMEEAWFKFNDAVKKSLSSFATFGGETFIFGNELEAKLACLTTGVLLSEYLVRSKNLDENNKVLDLKKILEAGV